MLIKRVYEIDPPACPECGGVLKIVAFIEPPQGDVIEKILKHCGLWQPATPRPPPTRGSRVHDPDDVRLVSTSRGSWSSWTKRLLGDLLKITGGRRQRRRSASRDQPPRATEDFLVQTLRLRPRHGSKKLGAMRKGPVGGRRPWPPPPDWPLLDSLLPPGLD